jgi:futalosine hydrolase
LSITNYYIVSATQQEVQPLIDYCKKSFAEKGNLSFIINPELHLCISIHGVGIASSTYHITKICATKPTCVIQAGIAGTFNNMHAIGNVYCVGADRFADIGAQDVDNFIDAYEMNLIDGNAHPYSNGWLFNTELPYPVFFTGLMHVNAVTVNTVSGNANTIAMLTNKYKPTLESMEGASLHLVCLQEKISFLQLRAVSNLVEVRDVSKWNIPLAIQNLNMILVEFVEGLV